MINKYQRKYKELVGKLKHTRYHNNYFYVGVKVTHLICISYKIVVPTFLQNYVVYCYHEYLMYPVIDINEATIIQHYHWTNIRYEIWNHINFGKTGKTRIKIKIWSVSRKGSGAVPWEGLSIDLIIPCKIIIEDQNDPLILKTRPAFG